MYDFGKCYLSEQVKEYGIDIDMAQIYLYRDICLCDNEIDEPVVWVYKQLDENDEKRKNPKKILGLLKKYIIPITA